MRVDLNSASPVSPPSAPVTDSQELPSPHPTPINPQTATPVAPQQVPTNVALDPLSGAGVRLTTYVLGILFVVLLLLLIAFRAQEKEYNAAITDAYRSAFGSLAISPSANRQTNLFDPVLTTLRSVENDPLQTQARQLLKTAADKLSPLENLVADKPSVEKLVLDIGALAQDMQGKSLNAARLHDIVARTEALRSARVPAGETLEELKARQDLLKAYEDAANATREFWVRIAQMILLNLLLPVLTGLLGYVFASRPPGK